MFEELFTKPRTIGRYQAAPLVEPRERYLRHLAESGARRLTLRQIALDQVRLLHLLDLREGGKIAVAQIEAIAPKWDRTRHHKLGHRPRTSRKSLKRALSRVTRWLRFLGWLDEPEEDRHPYSVELGAFEEWMRAERCLAEETIGNSLRSAREFLDWLTARGKHLASVRVADIDAAIEAKQTGRQYSRVTIRGYPRKWIDRRSAGKSLTNRAQRPVVSHVMNQHRPQHRRDLDQLELTSVQRVKRVRHPKALILDTQMMCS